MKRGEPVVRVLIVVFLLLLSIMSVSGAGLEGDCTLRCEWDEEELACNSLSVVDNCAACYIPSYSPCESMEFGNCLYTMPSPDCVCVDANPDSDSATCYDNSCTPDVTSGDDGKYFFTAADFNAGNSDEAGGTARCCGDDSNEYYIYSSGGSGDRGCCDDADHCVWSNHQCYSFGSVAGSNEYYCADTDWERCNSGGPWENKIISSEDGSEATDGACCYDDGGGLGWIQNCGCRDYQSLCETSTSCNIGGRPGEWIPYSWASNGQDDCCTGGTTPTWANNELIGDGSWPGCGTLEPSGAVSCDGGCLCLYA